eukprot:CAMPEP_0174830724 /NCGR_PEP_ID=MMETSP1114-20130205/2682_1 /TAXON_ID=312471 /ORGANISM="Neobodo designis, Strain CCAP 1951/1" /LENGTH=936 /DNA_ID=CAMNT_0016064527 /DNA_START=106 /DNA_END=2916 /DNA_ORIENTATION=+
MSAGGLQPYPGSSTTLSATFQSSGNANVNAYGTLIANVSEASADVLSIVVDAASTSGNQTMPYVVPDAVFARPAMRDRATMGSRLRVQASSGSDLLTVTDINTNEKVFAVSNLEFGVGHLRFTSGTDVVSTFLSGYGERDFAYFINNATLNGAQSDVLSDWNTDNGTPWKKPMYGVHPVVFAAKPTSALFYAIVFMNSHAQQLVMDRDAGLTFFAIGGRLDAFVIRGDTMLDVVRSYHQFVAGRPYMPPYWSLGTHQCRWGYKTLSDIEQVVANYTAAGIPLEVMWSDIDYMYKFRVFTTDPDRYPMPALAAFIEKLHNEGRKYVQIIDPGVAQALNYSTYDSGIQSNVYVTQRDGTTPLVNVVWPGWTVFPDFTSDRVGDWWKGQMVEYMQTKNIDLDGVWLDMNEVASFCQGQCDVPVGTPWTFNWLNADFNVLTETVCRGNCSVVNSWENWPAETPLTNGFNLTTKTLDLTGITSLGKYYDTKAFYGLMECKQSHRGLLEMRPTKRPFLLTRASFIGSGQYTSHWTGDNEATWEARGGGIKDSIQACLGANLWGISQVGADIGGFFGKPEQQLLTRWTQLGSFYTFTRNHHGLDTSPGSEPYRWDAAAVATMRDAYLWRYRLLPFFYTLLMDSHLTGGPAMRHPTMNFPTDAAAYHETYSFFLGDSMLVAPVVDEDATSVTTYVPAGVWYRLRPAWTDAAVIVGPAKHVLSSAVYNDQIPVLVAAGTVIPQHTTPALTVKDTRASGISLLCLLDANGLAAGHLFVDSAESAPTAADATLAYRLDVQCAANLQGGVISVSATNPSAHRPTDAPVPTGGARFSIRFFEVVSRIDVSGMVVNGQKLSSGACSVVNNTLTCTLPDGVDASQPLEVAWGERANSVADAHDDTVHISKAGLVAALVGGAVLGAIAAAVIMHLRAASNSRRNNEDYSRVQ